MVSEVLTTNMSGIDISKLKAYLWRQFGERKSRA
jgi:hypothetical protein